MYKFMTILQTLELYACQCLLFPLKNKYTDFGPANSVGWASAWYSDGRGFNHAIFLGDWSWNPFYGYSLPTADSSRAVVSYWWKDVHWVLANHLGLSLPRKGVVRLNHKQTNSQNLQTSVQSTNEPRHEKTCPWGLRPGKSQTGLLSYSD